MSSLVKLSLKIKILTKLLICVSSINSVEKDVTWAVIQLLVYLRRASEIVGQEVKLTVR